MYGKNSALIVLLAASLASALDLKLSSGEIITVDDDSGISPAKAPLSGPAPVGAISPRQLFGRQSGCYNPEQRVTCGVVAIRVRGYVAMEGINAMQAETVALMEIV
ncbi:MAG: hypothetical protein M1812_007295 [Candelaria pacifica]|nr:MAG: hypothetical protein M1812_007295 [Candelaria pacifica]